MGEGGGRGREEEGRGIVERGGEEGGGRDGEGGKEREGGRGRDGEGGKEREGGRGREGEGTINRHFILVVACIRKRQKTGFSCRNFKARSNSYNVPEKRSPLRHGDGCSQAQTQKVEVL